MKREGQEEEEEEWDESPGDIRLFGPFKLQRERRRSSAGTEGSRRRDGLAQYTEVGRKGIFLVRQWPKSEKPESEWIFWGRIIK